MKMPKFKNEQEEQKFWDEKGVLNFIQDGDEYVGLESQLKQDILHGRRKRRLKNISLKLDPVYVTVIKKIATQKSLSYQSLIRHWLSENIKRELKAGN